MTESDAKTKTKAASESDDRGPSFSNAWLAGALGAAIALALGELFDRLSSQLTSLVIGVGNLFVDLTPGDLVATSINTLGPLQKPLLLGGITVGAIALGGFLGTRSRNSITPIIVGFGIFGLFGGWAAGRSELTSAGFSLVVALIAAAVGAAVAIGLLRLGSTSAGAANGEAIVPGTPLSQATDRRHLLAFGGAAAGAVVLTGAGRLGRTSAAELARENIITGGAGSAGTIPAPTINLPVGEFDGVAGLASRITPISPVDDFYLIDTALAKPQVDPATWSLSIDGEYVDNPISYTYEELLARDLVEREVTLSCVSNPIGGDLVDNAVWTGIPVTELLEEAGVQDPTNDQHQFFSTSVDGFTCGFPLPLAYDGRTAMLALMMNGEPLPINHGFPARLVIAGLYGYVSATKWIERISITDWIGVDGFWMPRGWSKEGPVKTQSRIDVPVSGATITGGSTAVGGVAWSPTIGIEQVEIAIEDANLVREREMFDENAWTPVQLANTESDETWVQWRHDWEATSGEWVMRVRATDKTGFTQSPFPVMPAPNGAEGYHTTVVRVV